MWYMGGRNGAVWELLSQTVVPYMTGVPGRMLAGAADFDHDGRPDLVWQNDCDAPSGDLVYVPARDPERITMPGSVHRVCRDGVSGTRGFQ